MCFPDSLWPQQSSGTRPPWPPSCFHAWTLPWRSRHFSYMEKLARQHQLVQIYPVREAPRRESTGANPLAVAALHPPSLPLPLHARGPKSYENTESWCSLFLIRGRGGAGEGEFWQPAEHVTMLWREGLVQQARKIAHLCWALPHQCHTGSICKGHKEQTTAQLYFHRRRCKPDGLKEHYTLNLAGRLLIYNNKFAVKEHRGLMSFPYFKEILSPPAKFGLFLS